MPIRVTLEGDTDDASVNIYSLSELSGDFPTEVSYLYGQLLGNELGNDNDLLISDDGVLFKSTGNGVVPIAQLSGEDEPSDYVSELSGDFPTEVSYLYGQLGNELGNDNDLLISEDGVLFKSTGNGVVPIAQLSGEDEPSDYVNLYSLSELSGDFPTDFPTEVSYLYGQLLGNELGNDNDLLISEDGVLFRTSANGFVIPIAELSGDCELGKGFKMPKLKMPKLKMPKLKMPKLKMPKLKMPKLT